MGQFAAGIFLFMIPGILPAYAQYKKGRKSSLLSMGTAALCYAFLILVCTSGIVYLLFGNVVLSYKYHPYMLPYVFWFVGAYGISLILIMKVLMRESAISHNSGRICLIMFSGLWMILFAGVFYDDYARRHIVINEVCAGNLSLALDSNGDNSDYIELYNPSWTTVSLEGWYLTDREGGPGEGKEDCLPEIYIGPKSYLLLFADGTARSEQYTYLGFRISEQGEVLTLADDRGNLIDSVEVPALTEDTSYARLEDGKDSWSIVRYGTPAKTNEGLESYVIPTLHAPGFSVRSGFYAQPFALSLSAEEGEKIYYTLDGSVPTEESVLYTSPITIQDATAAENYYANIGNISSEGDYRPSYRIDKCTVVKAICINEAKETSAVASQVYFVGFDEKSGYDGIRVMSIEADPADFFSEDRGIYVLGDRYQDWVLYGEDMGHSFAANYTHADRTAERMVSAALFDADKRLVEEEKIGVRIRGGASRNLRQKGLNFYARTAYGEDPLGLCTKMLRTSGSIDTNVTMLRDVFNQSLVEDRHLETQQGEPCIVFLNGEYWGLYNLQDRFTKGYFKEKYGLEENDVIMIKQDNRVSIGQDSDMELYSELVSYARKQDLSCSEEYERIGQMMDIQSFIDHYCFEIYIGNTDWPLNNICCWRSRTAGGRSGYEDGRWRWGIYDTDESTGIYRDGMGTYASNPFLEDAHWFGTPLTTPLMSNLIENAEFKQQFATTFMDMINKNFAYDYVHDKLYEMAEIYAEPMVKSYSRFNGGEYTLDTFWANIAVIDEFYRKRADYVVPDFADALGLSGTVGEVTLQTAYIAQEGGTPVLSSECGEIVLNTITPRMQQGEWSGSYLTDYPVTVRAQAARGYRFTGWQGACESADEMIEAEVSENGICLTAVFEPIE